MGRRPLIAVINDDPAFLEFIASFVETETTYETVVWDEGTGSLEKLRKHQPDLVILDVRLGDQPVGNEILVEMRRDPALRTMPVIVCTADSRFLQEEAGLLKLLNARTLEKPFDLDDLEEMVRDAIGGEREQTEIAQPDPIG